MKRKSVKKKFAFSLLEVLLYIAIAGGVLTTATIYLLATYQNQVRARTVAEVEQQGQQVMRYIGKAIRNADAINSPTIGTSSSSTQLASLSTGLNPTTFSIVGSNLVTSEGGGVNIQLTNSRVNISGLTFYNVSRAGTPGALKVTFTINYVNPSGRREYDYSRIFTSTFVLK